jgi:hypothetical protein
MGSFDLDPAVQMHDAFAELVIAKRFQGQGRRAGCSSANMVVTCRFGRTVDARVRPALSQ